MAESGERAAHGFWVSPQLFFLSASPWATTRWGDLRRKKGVRPLAANSARRYSSVSAFPICRPGGRGAQPSPTLAEVQQAGIQGELARRRFLWVSCSFPNRLACQIPCQQMSKVAMACHTFALRSGRRGEKGSPTIASFARVMLFRAKTTAGSLTGVQCQIPCHSRKMVNVRYLVPGSPSLFPAALHRRPCQVLRRSISLRIAASTPGLSRHHDGPMK